MRFSINTIGFFRGKAFSEIFPILQGYGLNTFELWGLGSLDLPALKKEMDAFGMTLSACCPSFFTLNDASCHDRYEENLRQAIKDCLYLGCKTLITQAGQDNGQPRAQQQDAIVSGLRRMAPILADHGIVLALEPLNDVKDHKGTYLTDSNEGFEILRQVDSPNVRLLFDVYHQHHMGEDVLRRVEDNLSLIQHFHIAGHPDRDDRIFENYDYQPFFDLLKRLNAEQPVGLELFPRSESAAQALLTKISALG